MINWTQVFSTAGVKAVRQFATGKMSRDDFYSRVRSNESVRRQINSQLRERKVDGVRRLAAKAVARRS